MARIIFHYQKCGCMVFWHKGFLTLALAAACTVHAASCDAMPYRGTEHKDSNSKLYLHVCIGTHVCGKSLTRFPQHMCHRRLSRRCLGRAVFGVLTWRRPDAAPTLTVSHYHSLCDKQKACHLLKIAR